LTDLKNEFSWSTSRDRLFKSCKRAYYYHYYGSWGGWERNAPPEVREAYILKKLTNGKAWAGAHVHRAVSVALRSLKSGGLVPESELIESALDTMRADYSQSRNGDYRRYPTKACGFFEHEYGLEKPPEYWKFLAEGVESCIRNFYASDIFEIIRETDPGTWLVIDSNDFDKERDSFVFEGETVYAKIDFAFGDSGCVHIIDWKTGKELSGNEEPLQFHTYALYAVEKWGVPVEGVSLVEANLSIPGSQDIILTGDGIERLKEYMRDSIGEMKALLSDPENNVAEIGNFPVNEGKHCRRCNFYKLCSI
jgi:CRISPR/Cas system-associated exonuclease Cas4 (RecB family)